MLKRIFRTYGRHRVDELKTALLSLSLAELVSGLVELFSAGELRLGQKTRAKNICSKFYQYHQANPQVADWFLKAAKSLQQEGREHYGIGAITERIRFHIRAGVIKTDGFRISNDIRACYARLILMRDPSLCGMFTLKSSAADALVVDGRSWADFAKEHHAELWPDAEADAVGAAKKSAVSDRSSAEAQRDIS